MRSLPGKSGFSGTPTTRRQDFTPDVLRFLLPGLCHLIAEDKSREILVRSKIHEIMFAYLTYHWSIFDSFKEWLTAQVRPKFEPRPFSRFARANLSFAGQRTGCGKIFRACVHRGQRAV